MGNSPCFAGLLAQEVPEVVGPSGKLQKGCSAIVYKDSLWMPGTVTKAWSNNTVGVSISDGGCTGDVTVQARDVFLLELEGNFFRLQEEGRPSYCKLLEASELPFLLATPSYGALVRGLQVVVLFPEGERSGTVLSLRCDGQVEVEYEDGAHSFCAVPDVFPIDAYYAQQGTQGGMGDMLTGLIGGMAMDEAMDEATDLL